MADKDKDTRLSPLDDKKNWPGLAAYVSEVKKPSRDIIGRDKELMEVMASLNRPELSNVMLLAPPGSGKTALVQAASVEDPSRVYLEIDLSRMISGVPHPHELAARLKNLFDEVVRYHDEVGQELVLFIDEFHQIPQMSQAAVEAIKPILADSGTRGINLIAATTFEEYNEFVKSNKALDERLQRISITPTNGEMTVEILRGMAKTYGVDDQFYDDHIYELIFEWSQRYMESSTQPRKSIRLLDAMIGRHRFTGEKLDEKLLAEMLKQMTGINVAFVVDGDTIKQRLDEKVFSQDAATTALSRRLQLAVADLNDKSRPMLSALFTGPTGVGKTELSKQLSEILFDDDTNRLIRFDMSEFVREESLPTFTSELTQKVSNMGHAIILFDEVEKANPAITRLLLQVLDDGRMRDDYGREVSFLSCYIIMTTNAGSEVFRVVEQYASDDTGSSRAMADFEKVIRDSIKNVHSGFPPELLGRIDVIVPFQPLSRNTQRKIVKRKLRELHDTVYARHGVKLRIDDKVLDYVVEDRVETDTEAGGARGAVRVLTDEVSTEVAMFLNRYKGVRNVQVGVEGTMRFEDKTMLKSEASIVVGEAVMEDA